MVHRILKIAATSLFVCGALVACGGGGGGSNSGSSDGDGDNSGQGGQFYPNLSVPMRSALETLVKSDSTTTFSVSGMVDAENPTTVTGSGRYTQGAAQPTTIQVNGPLAGRSALLATAVMTGNITAAGRTSSFASTANVYYDPATFAVMLKDDGQTQFEYTPHTVPEMVKAGAAGSLGSGTEVGCPALCSRVISSYSVEPDTATSLLVRVVHITEKFSGRDVGQIVYRIDTSGAVSLVSLTMASYFDGQTLTNIKFTFAANRLTPLPAPGPTPTAPPASPSTPPPETPTSPGSGSTSFAATTALAPADGAGVSGRVRLEIRGSGIENAELLPASGYTPVYGTFSVSEDNTSAVLDFDTRSLPNGPIQLRVSAFNVPAGQSGAREIIAMSPRSWTVENAASNPDLVSTTQATEPYVIDGVCYVPPGYIPPGYTQEDMLDKNTRPVDLCGLVGP